MNELTPDIETMLKRLGRKLEQIGELEGVNGKLRKENQLLQECVCQLTHQVNQNSSNTHHLPSTDDPWEEDGGIRAGVFSTLWSTAFAHAV